MLQKFLGRFPVALSSVALLLAACSGGGGVIPAQPSNSGTSAQAVQFVTQASAALPEVLTNYGYTYGTDNKFAPNDGDSQHGGQGQSIATISGKNTLTCGVMSTNVKYYHIHTYVGVLVNGVPYSTPDAIGIDAPGSEDGSNGTNSGKCFYPIHTHDASGLVHIETYLQIPYSSVVYYLGDLLRVWGQTISSTSFAGLTGPVTVCVAGTQAPFGKPGFQYSSSTCPKWTGDPQMIPLTTHGTIWVQVGSVVTPPIVHFYTAH